MFAKSCLYAIHAVHYLMIFIHCIPHGMGRVTTVSSGPECAAALADPTVDRIILLTDLQWRDADWAGYDTPVPVLRNVTLMGTSGPDDSEKWPLLVMGPISAKIRLGNSVALRFLNLVVDNTARTYQSLAPGLNILAPCLPGQVAFMEFINVFIILRVCYSETIFAEFAAATARPTQYPGQQVGRFGLSQAGCINISNSISTGGGNGSGVSGGGGSSTPAVLSALPPAVWMQRQCWALRGSFDDAAIYGMEFQPDVQRQVPNGILVYLRSAPFVCKNLLSDECIRKLGYLGCWLAFLNGSTFTTTTDGTAAVAGPTSALTPATSVAVIAPPVAGSNVSDGAARSDGDGGAGVSLPALLGGLFGGLLVLAIAGLAGWGWRRAVLRRQKDPSLAGCQLQPPWPQGEKCDHKGDALQDPAVLTRPRSYTEVSLALAAAVGRGGTEDGMGGCCGNCDSTSERIFGSGKSVGGKSDECRQRVVRDSSTTAKPVRNTTRADDTITIQLAEAEGGSDHPVSVRHDPYVVVTPLTPPRPDLEVGVGTVNEVRLMPRVLGKGSFGKVVEGEYRGMNVAVKLLPDCNWALWGLAPAVAADAVPGSGGSAGGVPAATVKADAAARRRTVEDDDHNDGGLAAKEAIAAAAAHDCPQPITGAKQENSVDGDCPPLRPTMRHRLTVSLAQEVEVLGRCDHPNVVRLLAACLVPPRVCLVMELMDVSLDRMLYGIPGRLLPIPVVLDLAIDVARGLEYLHPTIVHRDLKPANVLIKLPTHGSDRVVAKLTDFGLSRLQYGTVPTRNPEVGTPEYMAPELFDPEYTDVQHYVDIYSFGVLLWTLLTGLFPWEGVNVMQMAYRVTILHDRLPLSAVPHDRQYERALGLLRHCWEQDPRRRPAAAELVKELELLRREIPIVSSVASCNSGSGVMVMSDQPLTTSSGNADGRSEVRSTGDTQTAI